MATHGDPDKSHSAAAPEASVPHRGPAEASPWVLRFVERVPAGGAVLDLACGRGRHTRLFLARGHPVTALDRDVSDLSDLDGSPGLEILEADLEDGTPWPLEGRRFAGLVVTNYLYRPLFPVLIDSLESGGCLIYETFARGNERYGRPRNPDHLLKPGELLEAVRDRLQVLAYEDLVVERPHPAAVQRICAVKETVEA